MSYTPTDWKTGDVITAEKLNNVESGIVGAVLSLEWNGDGSGPNKTWQEIRDAVTNGGVVVFNGLMPFAQSELKIGTLVKVTAPPTTPLYSVKFLYGDSYESFSCSNANDYPKWDGV